MGCPTKIQFIKRQSGNEQFFVNLPVALARALHIQPGEEVEWEISREGLLVLMRPHAQELIAAFPSNTTIKEK